MKKKIIIFLILLSLLGLALFLFSGNKKTAQGNPTRVSAGSAKTSENDVIVVSTDPNPLENTIVSENQIIKIVFSDSLENTGELKYSIEPKVEVKIKLSQDRKTLTIKPEVGFALGNTYTLFIKPDSKFDGGKRLNGDKMYHFKTVTFRGF